MKKCLFMFALILFMGLTNVSLSGCAMGGHIGPVGGGAAVG